MFTYVYCRAWVLPLSDQPHALQATDDAVQCAWRLQRMRRISVVTKAPVHPVSSNEVPLSGVAVTEDSGAVYTPAGLLPDQAETGGREAADISADHRTSRDLSETIAGTQVAQVVAGGCCSNKREGG